MADEASSPSAAGSASDVPRRDEAVRVPGAEVKTVCTPQNASELAAVVENAVADRTGLLVLGGRTRLEQANRAGALGLGISLEAISGIDEFEPDEGVIHVLAGTPIARVREAVAKEGWELPLDSPGVNATVGGTIASAATGPRALAFGPVKDAILGLGVVGGDGVATKCGGRVVKNVTGYDMAKLYCGSFGSLAIVTGAWLRLRPAPALRQAWHFEVPGEDAAARSAFESARQIARRPSVRALVWEEAPSGEAARLVIEFGGSPEGVAQDVMAAREALSASSMLGESASGPGLAMDDDAGRAIDHVREGRLGAGASIVIRARVLPSRADEMRHAMLDVGLSVSVDVGRGVLQGVGDERRDAVNVTVDSLLGLRTRAEALGGFVVFERIPESWREGLDVFGTPRESLAVFAGLANRFDPARILNPGRFLALDADSSSRNGVSRSE